MESETGIKSIWRLLLAGILMLGLGVANLVSLAGMARWTEQTAVMEKVEITELPRDTGKNYELNVRYRWDINGRAYHGQRITTDDRPFGERAQAEKRAARFPVNSSQRCWVNPEKPAEAVLDRWHELDFGLVFTGLGLGFLVAPFIWPRWVSKPWRWRVGDRPSFPRQGWGWGLGLLCSGGLIGGLAVREAMDHWRSRDWRETPCRILESRVIRDNEEFKAVISYQWEAEGTVYESNRVDWSRFQGGVLDAEKITAAHPVGQLESCRVNPFLPSEAVLNAGFVMRGEFYWIFGLLLVLVTGAGFLSSCKRWRRACRGWTVRAQPAEPQPPDRWSGRWPEASPGASSAPVPLPEVESPWCQMEEWFTLMPRFPLRSALAIGGVGAFGIWRLSPAVMREWDYGHFTSTLVFWLFSGLLVLSAGALVVLAVRQFFGWASKPEARRQ